MVVNLFFYEWPHSFAATIAIIIVSNVAHHSVFKLFTKKKVKHLLETVYGVSFFLHSKNIPKTDSGSKEEKAISNCTLRMNHFVIKISIIQWLFRKLISAFCACPYVLFAKIIRSNYQIFVAWSHVDNGFFKIVFLDEMCPKDMQIILQRSSYVI